MMPMGRVFVYLARMGSCLCLPIADGALILSAGVDACADYTPALVAAMTRNGLTLSHRFGRVADTFELSFKSAAGLKLDIFFFYDEGERTWNGGTQASSPPDHFVCICVYDV